MSVDTTTYLIPILFIGIVILLILIFSKKRLDHYGRIDDPNLPINQYIRKYGLDPDKIERVINRKKDSLGLQCLADLDALKAYCLTDLVKTQTPLFAKTAYTFDEYKDYKNKFMESCLDKRTISDLCSRGSELVNTYVKYSRDTEYELNTINVLLKDIEKDWEIPEGSYQSSCKESKLRRINAGDPLFLESLCERKKWFGFGKENVKTILKDYKGCKDILNEEGVLKCVKR